MAYTGILDPARPRQEGPRSVVYDARDIYIHARNIARLPGPATRLFGWVEKRWARAASRIPDRESFYADVLQEAVGPPRPAIVMNCSPRRPPPPELPRRFHDALTLSRTARVVLYQGGPSHRTAGSSS